MKKRLTDPSQVPPHLGEKEEARFWSRHEITKEYLDKAEQAVDADLPPRSKSISVRFDEDTLQRLKRLAAQRGKRYQTLLKEFVIERLREEEVMQKVNLIAYTVNPAVSAATRADVQGQQVKMYTGWCPAVGILPSIPFLEDAQSTRYYPSTSSKAEPNIAVIGYANNPHINRRQSVPEQNPLIAHG